MTETKHVPRKQIHSRDAIYQYICEYKAEHDGLSPSFREIGLKFGIESLSMIQYILADLKRQGRIKLVDGKSRGIIVVGGSWCPPA